jgi:hypothetical protein
MKIYTLFTPSHRFLFENYFLKTFPFDARVELRILLKEQLGNAEFHGQGWRDTMHYKTRCFLQAAKEVQDQGIFMFIDPDIQFFDNFYDEIMDYMKNNDAVFQNDYNGGVNTGFFAMRSTGKTRQFLQLVEDNLHRFQEEQQCFNFIINKFDKHSDIAFNVSMLPKKYWTYGEFNQNWEEGLDFDIPKDIVIHHGNWTKPFANKIKLLNLVREKYESIKKI